MEKYVSYLRVSTKAQGSSGLGLAAQRKMCCDFIKSRGGECVTEFKDIESGTHRDRKGLADAVEFCKNNKCALVVAKLDRLARDVEFCFKIINTGIEIYFTDMPQINTLLLGVFASVAQYERELTSDRTRKALAAKRERGEKTGGASDAWKLSWENKSDEKKKNESMERGKLKNKRHFESKDVQTFIKVLRNVFPTATNGDVVAWDWKAICTHNGVRQKILSLMRDYHDIDATLFARWDFSDLDGKNLQVKLAGYIKSLRNSAQRLNANE